MSEYSSSTFIKSITIGWAFICSEIFKNGRLGKVFRKSLTDPTGIIPKLTFLLPNKPYITSKQVPSPPQANTLTSSFWYVSHID